MDYNYLRNLIALGRKTEKNRMGDLCGEWSNLRGNSGASCPCGVLTWGNHLSGEFDSGDRPTGNFTKGESSTNHGKLPTANG